MNFPSWQFQQQAPSDTRFRVSEHRGSVGQWVKDLRAELGTARGRKKISQTELARLINPDPNEDSTSMVAKWEMKKDPQTPERDSCIALLRLASPALRARAPRDWAQFLDLPDMSDPGARVSSDANIRGDHQVTTPEGRTVGQELDEIEDLVLRKRARDAALQAITAERAKENPSLPVAGKSGTARRRS